MARGHRQDGNVARDTGPQVASKRMRAERSKCPECGRKSALIGWTEPGLDGLELWTACRWKAEGKCSYVKMRVVGTLVTTDAKDSSDGGQ